MNIASQLPFPLNTFVVDIPSGQFYDFHLPENSTYPLQGVIYPVDYGHILGYTAEDGAELDLFVGNSLDGKIGSITVDRGEVAPQERKLYAGLTNKDLEDVLKELQPVLLAHHSCKNMDEFLNEIEIYRNKK